MSIDSSRLEERYPDYFRRRDADWVFNKIKAGQSCSLVGMGSVGKSNLMQALTTRFVKFRCLQAQAPTTLTVLIDPHKMIHLEQNAIEQAGAAWPGYEILLNRLRRSLADLESDKFTNGLLARSATHTGDIIAKVEAYYINLFDTHPLLSQSGIRHLEESVYEVLQMDGPWRIVFLFDEIEGFLHLPPEFFQSMRGLRDEFKDYVSFVTSSRAPLGELMKQRAKSPEDHGVLEGFIELFHGSTHYINLLDDETARLMIKQLKIRFGIELNDADLLMNFTGKHAGLLSRTITPFSQVDGMGYSFEQLFDHLLTDRGVLQECEVMFNSLSPAEQDFLRQIVSDQPVSMKEDTWKDLSSKHLVTAGVNGQPTLTMPVLGGYVYKEMMRNNRSS